MFDTLSIEGVTVHVYRLLGALLVGAFVTMGSTSSQAAEPNAAKKTYASSCQTCHGASGNGKGPAAMALRPPPPDFTAASYWSDKADSVIEDVIRNGRPGTAMKGTPGLTDAEVADLVAYLKSFRAD